MNRRQRLMATLRGEWVDRPAVSFYELNGLDEHPHDNDPFNILDLGYSIMYAPITPAIAPLAPMVGIWEFQLIKRWEIPEANPHRR